MSQHLYLAGMILSGIIVPAAGVWILRARRRVEREADVDPAVLLKAELARAESLVSKREAELEKLREADAKERAAYIEALTEIKNAMTEIASDLKAHREEERERTAKVHERLSGMDTRLTVIETRLERP